MMQEPSHRPTSSHKRTNRAGRKRPVLVTSTVYEELSDEQTLQERDTLSPEIVAKEEPAAPVEKQPLTLRRRLPNFFSTVGKSTETESAQKTDAAQARLARATRGKPAVATAKATAGSKNSQVEVKKEPAKSSAPARPGFKTRYLLGMVLYLIGANFIGIYETDLLRPVDSILTQFPFFTGGTIVIRTSTIVYLVTLVVILVLLARFDLLPRSLGALGGQTPPPQSKRGASQPNTQNQTSVEYVKTPPSMKQGVKGAHDDLYQEYRTNQRRERKK